MITPTLFGYVPRRPSMILRIAPDFPPPSAPPYPSQVATLGPLASIKRASSSCFGWSAMSSILLLRLRIEYRANDHLQLGAFLSTMLIAEDVSVPQDILGQEDRRGDIALGSLRVQHPANRYAAFRFALFRSFAKLGVRSPALDRADADPEKGGDLVVSALH